MSIAAHNAAYLAPGPNPRVGVSPRRRDLTAVGRVAVRGLQVVLILAAVLIAGVTVGPRFLPYRSLVVRSGSMAPTIPTGSVAFYVGEPASQVQPGQIIAFSEPGNPNLTITHRVVRIMDTGSQRFFVTKGDANAVPDTWRVPAVGSGWIVVAHIPYLGYALYDLGSGWARIWLLGVPLALLAGIYAIEHARSDARRTRDAIRR